jgi:hypothetical protein
MLRVVRSMVALLQAILAAWLHGARCGSPVCAVCVARLRMCPLPLQRAQRYVGMLDTTLPLGEHGYLNKSRLNFPWQV